MNCAACDTPLVEREDGRFIHANGGGTWPCDVDDDREPDAIPEPEPEPRMPDGGPRGFEYSESERRDIRDAGRGHLL